MKQKSRNISCRGFLLPAAFGLLLILSAVALGVHSVGLRVIDQLTIEARAQKALSFSGASMLTELLNNPGNPGLRRGGFPFIECKLENRKLVKKLKYREGFCSQNSNFSYERFSGRYSGTLAQSSSLNLPLFDLSGLSAAINPVKCLNDNAPISQRLSAGLRAANTCGSINNSRHFEHVFIGNLLLERELVVPANANPRLGFGLIMASGSVNFVAPLKIQSNLVIIAGGAIEISSIESVGLGTLNVFLVSATDEIKVSLSSGALRINAITPARINIPVNVGVNLNYRPLPLFSRTALAIIR